MGNANRRTLPVWRKEGNKLIYKTELDDKGHMFTMLMVLIFSLLKLLRG